MRAAFFCASRTSPPSLRPRSALAGVRFAFSALFRPDCAAVDAALALADAERRADDSDRFAPAPGAFRRLFFFFAVDTDEREVDADVDDDGDGAARGVRENLRPRDDSEKTATIATFSFSALRAVRRLGFVLFRSSRCVRACVGLRIFACFAACFFACFFAFVRRGEGEVDARATPRGARAPPAASSAA